ncbi:MAG: glycosyltransferase family 1 protein [Desulfobacteraceae bacterium]|nr:glycosyltransferase family 1 protein [Desulfobacteraceae bacterium]MBC2718446.1 glycosyltransferase [Desulfobacteraceae bacterium]
MLTNENIICISWIDWEPIPLVMHQMMTRLAKKNRVLFVNHTYPLSLFITCPKMSENLWQKLKKWRSGVKQVTNNLHTYTPPPLLMDCGYSGINDQFNQAYIKNSILKVARKLKFKSPILWIYNPYAIYPKGKFDEKLVCYDCNDDMASLLSRFQYKKRNLRRIEEKFVKRADIVFTTSQTLYQSKKNINPNTYYFPSGIDVEVFSKALSPFTKIPIEMQSIKKPIVGFIGGMVSSKMNWDWIEKLSRSLPYLSITLVGPETEPAPSKIKGLPNVYFLGAKPFHNLPEYLKAFDVGIIPYKEGEFLRNCFPTKIFEYFAAGKPVVSADIPALRGLQPLVRLCKASDEFVASVESFIKKGYSNEQKTRCIDLSTKYTWDERVKKTSALINDLLSKKSFL